MTTPTNEEVLRVLREFRACYDCMVSDDLEDAKDAENEKVCLDKALTDLTRHYEREALERHGDDIARARCTWSDERQLLASGLAYAPGCPQHDPAWRKAMGDGGALG